MVDSVGIIGLQSIQFGIGVWLFQSCPIVVPIIPIQVGFSVRDGTTAADFVVALCR